VDEWLSRQRASALRTEQSVQQVTRLFFRCKAEQAARKHLQQLVRQYREKLTKEQTACDHLTQLIKALQLRMECTKQKKAELQLQLQTTRVTTTTTTTPVVVASSSTDKKQQHIDKKSKSKKKRGKIFRRRCKAAEYIDPQTLERPPRGGRLFDKLLIIGCVPKLHSNQREWCVCVSFSV